MTDTAGGSSDPTMQVLTADECYRLLATHEIGRIVVNAERYPLALPVNYGLDGTTLVIRTHPGTLPQAAEHTTLTFEVDDIDRRTRTGWSVIVHGQAEEVAPAQREELVARTRAAGVEPWAPGEHGTWIRLTTHEISGHRIVPGELPGLDPHGYL
jgi:nitroimidazol reductase NimA-like FMN-containing flavoprotein (pyridoxamine 5'-phosphate oxidase superfamily)